MGSPMTSTRLCWRWLGTTWLLPSTAAGATTVRIKAAGPDYPHIQGGWQAQGRPSQLKAYHPHKVRPQNCGQGDGAQAGSSLHQRHRPRPDSIYTRRDIADNVLLNLEEIDFL